MKVDAYGNIKASNNTTKKRGVSGAGNFSSILNLAESQESSGADKANEIIATPTLSSVLSLQEVSDEDFRRKKIIKHGENMLDSLENLRRRLLIGTVPLQTLREISNRLSTQKHEIADTNLIEIINDIELRTAVELAKLEMAQTSKQTPLQKRGDIT